MGAWGDGPFENDSALDWFAELEAGGVSFLRETLARVADTDRAEYLDVDDGSAAIAAAEVVAGALARARGGLPKRVVGWIRKNQSQIAAADGEQARRAVARVVARQSELRGLWDDAGSDSGWHTAIRDLLARLGGDLDALDDERAHDDGDAEATADRLRTVLLTFLGARGLEPTVAQRARILECTDLAVLERWVGRAASAPSVDAALR